jgi:hypothetical protein
VLGGVVVAPPVVPLVPPVVEVDPPVDVLVAAVDPPAPVVAGLVAPPVPEVLVLPPDPDVTEPEPVVSQAAIKKVAPKRVRNVPFRPETFCPTCLIALIASSVQLNKSSSSYPNSTG